MVHVITLGVPHVLIIDGAMPLVRRMLSGSETFTLIFKRWRALSGEGEWKIRRPVGMVDLTLMVERDSCVNG